MALVLILGSHVAGSRVGGTVASLALALSPFAIDPVHVPTTLLGRHPGWGPPGGGAVSDDIFAGMLEGIAANGLFALLDGVITNYFASPQQVIIAARAIGAIKAANPRAIVLVDPVMGDAPAGLYVNEAIASTLLEHLVPCADYLTPNLWELGQMTGLPTTTIPQIRFAARTLGKPTLVTSVPSPAGIGAMLVDGERSWQASHGVLPHAPKGTGDLVAALFMGHLINNDALPDAMAKALSGVSALLAAAQEWGSEELPIVAGAARAWTTPPLALVSSATDFERL
jgi:pyridoxine kinase